MLELVLVAALALAVILLVVSPLAGRAPTPGFEDPLPVEETRRGRALLAIKDLEFDHATGKLSDEDYSALKGRFTRDALQVLREEAADPAESLVAQRRALLDGAVATAKVCPDCGPRPEDEPIFCSSCGRRLVLD